MTYADYIQAGGTGIITLLSKNQALKFLLSDSIQPLDATFLMENGSKNFTLAVGNMLNVENDLTPIASMLKMRFGQYWQVLYNSQTNADNPVYSSITTTNGEIDTKGNTTNQVSGYDSPTMVDNDGSNSTGNQTTTHTVKTLNYEDLTKLLGELKNNVFYDKMFTDIRNYIFNTVYGNEKE